MKLVPSNRTGFQCKYSKKNSMMCWLLEDGVYDFYQNNCKNCKSLRHQRIYFSTVARRTGRD